MLRLGMLDPDPSWVVVQLHADHLGSVRAAVVDPGVANLTSRHDYLPFGEDVALTSDFSTHQYTGHERDKETGLDYMMARYYGAGVARFLSSDPLQDSAQVESPASDGRMDLPAGSIARTRIALAAITRSVRSIRMD